MLATKEKPRLTAQDRCDNCGSAQALFVASKNGKRLLFCKHHADRHGPELTAQGWRLDKAQIEK